MWCFHDGQPEVTRAERAASFEDLLRFWSRRVLGEVVAAVAFLTRLPVGTVPADSGRTGAAAFGLVGAIVGVVGAVALLVLGERAPLAAGGIAIGAVALVSGVLHLDGLADTADALAAPTPAASDRARKDPAVGPAGVAAIAIVVLVDVGLLATLAAPGDDPAAVAGPLAAAVATVVAGSGSRAVPVLAAVLLRRASRDGAGEGLGGWFASRIGWGSAVLTGGSALAIALVASIVLNRPAFVVGTLSGMAIGILFAGWLAAVRHGLDGDGLGATVEVGFAAVLLGIVLTL